MGPYGAGDLTERVQFQRREAVDDGAGNTEGDWQVLIASRAASLRPVRGGEHVIADRQQGISGWDLWVRFDAETDAVTLDDRVVDARRPERTFNIKFKADMDGRREWLLMQLELGGADG